MRKTIMTLLVVLVAELIIVMIWPRTLVWVAEIALRVRGVGNLF